MSLRPPLATLALLAGCGLHSVELAPHADEEIVIGAVPRQAIDQLRNATAPHADPMKLSFAYPATDAVLPESFAPITFQWSSPAGAAPAPKPSMMPMPKDAMMVMTKAPAAMAQPAHSSVFELRIKSPRSALRLYTTASEATLPAARWSTLLRESVSSKLQVELHALLAGALGHGPAVASD